MKHLKLFENYNEFYRELDFQQNSEWTWENKDLEPLSPSEIKYLSERFPQQYKQRWVYKDKAALKGYSVKEDVLKEPIYGINIINFIDLILHIEKHKDEYYHVTMTTKEQWQRLDFTSKGYRYFICDQFDGLKKFLDDVDLKNLELY